MSDIGRKDMSTKTKETLTPDAMKSDTQKIKEATTDTADHVAREGQTDTSKSTTQEILDKGARGKEHTKDSTKDHSTHDCASHETVGDKIKHAVGMDKK